MAEYSLARRQGKRDAASLAWDICSAWSLQVSWYQAGGLPRALLKASPELIGGSRPSLLRRVSPLARAEGRSRAFRKGRTRTAPLPFPHSPTQILMLKAASPKTLWRAARPQTPVRLLRSQAGKSLQEAAQSIREEPNHLSPLSYLVVTRAVGVGGGAMVNKETLFQPWSLLLDAVVPHKADGGLQSSPQQAAGSRDHQGFFLSDNQSGKQSQPLPVPALPVPAQSPYQPSASSQSSILLGRGLVSLWMSGKGLPSLGSVLVVVDPFLPLCQSQNEG